MASLMLLLEALVGGEHDDIAMECDPADKCREDNVRATIEDETPKLYAVHRCASGSSTADKEMHTWEIAHIFIWH